jgi:hypothetical protein
VIPGHGAGIQIALEASSEKASRGAGVDVGGGAPLPIADAARRQKVMEAAAQQWNCTTIASAVMAWVPRATAPSGSEIGSGLVVGHWVSGSVADYMKDHTLAVLAPGARVHRMPRPCPGPMDGVIPSLNETGGWRRWAIAAPGPCMRGYAGLVWRTRVSGGLDEHCRCRDDPKDLHDPVWRRLGGACAHPCESGLGSPARPPDGSMEYLC